MAGKRNDHGYTDEQVVAEYRRIGSAKGTARSLGVPETSLKRRLARIGVRKFAPKSGLCGVSISSIKTSKSKPQDSCRARFYELDAGKVYKAAEAAREWGVSMDTLKKHAKDLGVFVYAEFAQEQWEPAITKPEGGDR